MLHRRPRKIASPGCLLVLLGRPAAISGPLHQNKKAFPAERLPFAKKPLVVALSKTTQCKAVRNTPAAAAAKVQDGRIISDQKEQQVLCHSEPMMRAAQEGVKQVLLRGPGSEGSILRKCRRRAMIPNAPMMSSGASSSELL